MFTLFQNQKNKMEKELEKLKEIGRQLELFKDDISAYTQFIERNIRQGNKLVILEDKLKRIEEQATRRKRASGEQSILITDLEIVEDICREGK